jgi:hypothetical protein
MPTESLRSAIAKLTSNAKQAPGLVPDWEQQLPAGSRWRPGDAGDPACPTCRGVGYVSAGVPIGHPLFGKLFVCECAESGLFAAQQARLQEASALSIPDLSLSWGSVVGAGPIGLALSAARATLNDGFGWCYVWGPPGPGKTLMLKAAVAEAIRAGQAAVYVNWYDLLQHLRSGYDKGDYDERVERWRAVPVLAVDEFGRAKDTEWAREAQARIFNHRYEAAIARESVTLFASNFAPEKADDWFADRVHDGRFKVIEVVAPSMRPMMGSFRYEQE